MIMREGSKKIDKGTVFRQNFCHGMTKSHFLQIFKCQYLVEILRYGSNFLHVITTRVHKTWDLGIQDPEEGFAK